ncbi:MAG: hypothetical protein AB3N20_03530 [Rhizobiaceae bacterium]
MRRLLSVWLAGALTLAVTAAFANKPMDAEIILQGSEVRVNLGADLSNATLTIGGPNGYYAATSSERGSLSIDLIKTGGTADGVYTYEVKAATSETIKILNPVDNGERGARRGGLDAGTSYVPAYTFGSFRASGGIID